MPGQYLVLITLQTSDCTASLDPSEDVVAPPPVCLQGLGNGIENLAIHRLRLIFNPLQLAETTNCCLWKIHDLLVEESPEALKKLILPQHCPLTWISLQALWWSCR